MRENRKHTTRVSSDEARRLKDETDNARLDAMTDDDIAKAVAEDPRRRAARRRLGQGRLVIPPGKDIVTLRLDRDVLEWLRARQGYQTRINQVLRAFYDAQIGRPKRERWSWAKQRRKERSEKGRRQAIREKGRSQARRASQKARVTAREA